MAIYAIGDLQGCFDEFQALLQQLRFNPENDQLWLVGDLVNRGPESLQTLRYIMSLGDRAISVLGNHDLHLLALASGHHPDKSHPSLTQVLDAPDRKEILQWLRFRPLLHRDKKLGYTMFHAGLPPQWSLKQAEGYAHEVEAVLQDTQLSELYFKEMYGNKPKYWDQQLQGMDRWRYITNCLTRLRFLAQDGKLGLKLKGPPGTQKPGYIPWFEHPQRKTKEEQLIFGHWSTLGYQLCNNSWSLDSGCLWGGKLTALRIDASPPQVTHLDCAGYQHGKL